MAAPTLTYTLTNGTTADADQVMANFNALLNGITDGTKDLTISALTCNGAVALNSHVDLGDGTPDNISINGQIDTNVIPDADDTYDLGSSSLTWRAAFIGGKRLSDVNALSFKNFGLAASISSNILTIALKGADGNDPSSTNPVDLQFRSTTATTGTATTRTVTAATSLALGTAVSLGQTTATSFYAYIYALDNAGTIELFASAHNVWDESVVQSTSTTGTSNAVLYGANARSSMAITLLGRVKATWTNAVGWSALANVDVGKIPPCLIGCSYSSDTATAVTDGNGLAYDDKQFDTHNAYSTASTTFTCPAAGKYRVSAVCTTANVATGAANLKLGISVVQAGGTSNTKIGPYDTSDASVTRSLAAGVCGVFDCAAGDTLQFLFTESIPAVNLNATSSQNWLEVIRIQ